MGSSADKDICSWPCSVATPIRIVRLSAADAIESAPAFGRCKGVTALRPRCKT